MSLIDNATSHSSYFLHRNFIRKGNSHGSKALLCGCVLLLTGCAGPQSTLAPASAEAESISILFWTMTVGAFLIWSTVSGLAFYALQVAPQSHNERLTRRWVIGGGVIVPTLTLSVLLVFALRSLPGLLRPAPAGSMRIDVVGSQWWWRFTYPTSDGGSVEVANEVYLPVDEPVRFDLRSNDVVHSFWIPSLGGKVDMIPGHRTQISLRPQKTGTYRGVCAEYCGASHAHMAFDVVVTSRDDFDAWLSRQSQDAWKPTTDESVRGAEVFRESGCGACHTIRGTEADGTVGPDLTHVGSRVSLAAGAMDNTKAKLEHWIRHPSNIKPEVGMPGFHTLTSEEVELLATYLKGLK